MTNLMRNQIGGRPSVSPRGPWLRTILVAVVSLSGQATSRGDTIDLYAVKDTSVATSQPDRNFGAENAIVIGQSAGAWEALLSWRVSDCAPLRGATINRAQIQLTEGLICPGGTQPLPARVWRLTQDWEESQPTWNRRPEADPIPLLDGVLPACVGQNRKVTLPDPEGRITQWVQRVAKGELVDCGVALAAPEASGYATFLSKDNNPLAHRPKLIIDYTPAGTGSFTVAGQVRSRLWPGGGLRDFEVRTDTGQTAQTGGDGRYTLTGVPSGQRTLTVSRADFWTSENQSSAARVVLVDRDLLGVDFADFACKASPEVSASANKQVLAPGESFEVTLTMRNANYSVGDVDAYLDVSFEDGQLAVGTPATDPGWSSAVYRPPNPIWHADGTQIAAVQTLVSARHTGPYPFDESYSIRIPLTVKTDAAPGPVILKYRGTIADRHEPASGTEADRDQQGYYTKRLEVRIECVASDGLLLYLPLDGDAKDRACGGRHGTASEVYWPDGKNGLPNTACRFTGGVDSYVAVPLEADLNLPEGATVAFWMRAEDAGFLNALDSLNTALIGSAYNDFDWGRGWYLYLKREAGETLLGYQGFDGTQAGQGGFLRAIDVRLDHWHHLAFTKAGRDFRFYFDGALLGPATMPSEATHLNGLQLGGSAPGTIPPGYESEAYRHFKGSLDEFVVSSRALSELEVRCLAQRVELRLDRPPATGCASLLLAGCPGARYELQLSSDLNTWERLEEGVLPITGLARPCVPAFLQGPPRFFRVRLLE